MDNTQQSKPVHFERPGARITNTIDAGIGKITYQTHGSIPATELMEELAECIKNNGVRYTINVLNNAK